MEHYKVHPDTTWGARVLCEQPLPSLPTSGSIQSSSLPVFPCEETHPGHHHCRWDVMCIGGIGQDQFSSKVTMMEETLKIGWMIPTDNV